ncbi:sugar transferase [Flavobacterium sasangense]|uniref:sugar transferase n=1 Tax=Flavobacterium sasangense TaxID=503361 RepID=UPI00047C60B6|nr:sugar transferase [Flavobacterium sasangense]
MIIKRLFDLFFSLLLIIILSPILILGYVVVSIDTLSNGLFTQKRIGQYGVPFTIYKLKTIRPKTTTISPVGKLLRKSKIDELPQLFNVLFGTMSFVGPRPDIPGYYDKLEGDYRKILALKPGITCEASIKYADEELILEKQENPLQYNDTVIFPDKVQMNLTYYHTRTFLGDLNILLKTILGSF